MGLYEKIGNRNFSFLHFQRKESFLKFNSYVVIPQENRTIQHQEKPKNAVLFWFAITFALGLSFLYLEVSEFSRFIDAGASPQRSAFLSSFFALVGVHGFHISLGLLWMGAAMANLWFRGLLAPVVSRVFRLAFFWHFLDVVWIFIFTAVYAMGHLL